MADLKTFSLNADPVIRELIPVAQQLGPTLTAVNHLSPYLRRLFVQLGPLVTASQTGLPATQRILQGLGPNTLLDQLGTVPRAAQPDPRLARGPPAADLRLHLATAAPASSPAPRRSAATAPATTCGSSDRAAPRRSRWRRRATPTTAATRIPSSLWLSQIFNGTPGKCPDDWGLPAWDCKNATGGKDHATLTPSQSPPNGEQACWTQPVLPGASPYKVPPINAARYSTK